jgi:hypothetical protein
MDIKKVIRIIIIVVIAMVVVWSVVALVLRPGKKEVKEVSVKPLSETVQQKSTAAPSFQPQVGVTDEQQYVRQLSGIVVERFGTYSSHNRGANIDDILPLLSDAGEQWAERYRTQDSVGAVEYNGVTTKGANSEFLEWLPGGSAKVKVSASRIFTDAQGGERISSQDAVVSLSKFGGQWLVNEVLWE